MYPDKTVRRRRAVLAILVIFSLLLITAYFGESAGGGLHALQRGVSEVVSPVQSGASSALKPARDAIGWFGDTWDAKGKLKKLEQANDTLRRNQIDAAAAMRQNQAWSKILGVDKQAGLDSMKKAVGRITSRSTLAVDQRVKINIGSSAGVRSGQPVLTNGGLVGTIAKGTVAGDSAMVQLLTDADFGAAVRVMEHPSVQGDVQPAAGSPRALELRFINPGAPIAKGNTIITLGTVDSNFPGVFPPDIPVGTVSSVGNGTDDSSIRVEPFVDVRKIDYVQVLTGMPESG